MSDCSSLHYNILSSNCGSCPTTTTNTTVTCTDVPTDGGVCTFSVKTVVCGNIFGNLSDTLQVKLKDSATSRPVQSDLGAIVSACLFAGLFVVSTSILVILVIVILKLVNRCQKHNQVEADQNLSTRHYEAVHVRSQPSSSVAVNTEANIAYGLPSTMA